MEKNLKLKKNYVKVDSILYKLGIENDKINSTNCIEWIYDALSFISIEENTNIYFETKKVINFTSSFPIGLKELNCLFIYNNLNYEDFSCEKIITSINQFLNNDIYKNNFDLIYDYSIIGEIEKHVKFNFEKGIVGFLYQGIAIDEETGYPLILDNQHLISALEYYIKFKMAEIDFINQREGSISRLQYFEKKWMDFVRLSKNNIRLDELYSDKKTLIEKNNDIIINAKS